MSGFDTYYWVVDEPDSSGSIQNDINPGDSLVFRLRLICRQAGEYVFPLHMTVFSGNGIAFFSTANTTTVEVSNPCGDADASGAVDIDDVVYIINYIFAGGPGPVPYESGDADCSGAVDIDDVVYLIAYIFSGGNAPCDINGDEMPDC